MGQYLACMGAGRPVVVAFGRFSGGIASPRKQATKNANDHPDAIVRWSVLPKNSANISPRRSQSAALCSVGTVAIRSDNRAVAFASASPAPYWRPLASQYLAAKEVSQSWAVLARALL